MARIISYSRVSSELQRKNTSLESQRQKIEAYCEFSEHDLVAHCWDVETASGFRKRPGFQTALDAIYAGYADGLACAKLDRFARSALEGLEVVAELKENGKQLIVLDLNLDTTTPIGECIFSVLLAFAQLERETINERTIAGQRAVADAGGYAWGSPPYGWNAENKRLVINEQEQAVRQLIFDWHKAGMRYSWISQELNRRGIPAKRGGPWFADTVRKIALSRDSFKLASIAEPVQSKTLILLN